MRDHRARVRIDAPLEFELQLVAAAHRTARRLKRTGMGAAARHDVRLRRMVDRKHTGRAAPLQALLEAPVKGKIAQFARRPAHVQPFRVDPCRLGKRAVDFARIEGGPHAHSVKAGDHVARVALGAAAVFQRLRG